MRPPYDQIDHYHCWDQDKSPACGIRRQEHEKCCLCAKEWERELMYRPWPHLDEYLV